MTYTITKQRIGKIQGVHNVHNIQMFDKEIDTKLEHEFYYDKSDVNNLLEYIKGDHLIKTKIGRNRLRFKSDTSYKWCPMLLSVDINK